MALGRGDARGARGLDGGAIAERWGLGGNFQWVLPSLGDAPWGREYMARRQRNAATPGAWEAFARMAFDIDVGHGTADHRGAT